MDLRRPLSRRARDAAWPVVPAFGVDLRVHVTCYLLPFAAYVPFSLGREPVEAAFLAVFWSLVLLLVTWSHEMAHVWAARSVGAHPKSVTLWPLGSLFHLELESPSPHAERLTAAAGPVAHAGWFVAAGAPYVFLVQGTDAAASPGADMLRWFLAANAALVAVHLLPFWPLDGGRWLRAWLAVRVHVSQASMQAAYVGFAGALVLGLSGIAMTYLTEPGSLPALLGGPALCGLGAIHAIACRSLLSDARWGNVPYERTAHREPGPRRASWSLEEPPPSPPEPVAVEERRGKEKARRATTEVRRRDAARPAARPLEERIDELLDRINEVGGVEKLSEAERRELSDASRRLRGGDPGK